MISLGRILKDHREAGAFQALVSVQSVVGEGLLATKSGDLLKVLRVAGPDYECLDLEQLDSLARRFEAATRLFDERFRLYQYVFKRQLPPIALPVDGHPVVREAHANRLEHLRQSGPMYALETYFVVLYEGLRPINGSSWRRWLNDPLAAARDGFSRRESVHTLEQGLASACEFLSNKVASFVLHLRDVLSVKPLDSAQAFTFVRHLLNYDPTKAEGVKLRFNEFVDFQACDSSLECHRDFLRLDDDCIQVLTLKEPPARTFAAMFRGLSEISCNALAVSEWKREDALKVRRLIQSKRRHFHNTKASLLSYLNQPKTATPDVLIDDGAVAMVGDLGACLAETEVHGHYFGQFSITIALYHRDQAVVRRGVAQCLKIFGTHDAHLIEERYNRLNAWLAMLPGNSAYNLRRMWILNTNYADLSFLSTLHNGHPRNDHLEAPSLALFEGTGGVPYHFNLHHHDVAHTLVLGATGSGKSFLLNFLITHLQQYSPFTAIFDLGGSYDNLTRLFDGSLFALGESSRQFTINPFCLGPTSENLLFLFAFVKVLVESNGWRMSAEDEKDLFEQIENLYVIPADQRRLFTLANVVRRPIRMQLQRWVQGGPYATLFDNATDTLTLSRFQTFDFEGMTQAADQVEPLLFYVLHRASAAITAAAESRVFKVFVIDEAWRFFRHPVIRAYIVEALKTWRKKNAAMILATQSSADLLASDLLPTLVESCVTKLFLANPGMNGESYRDAFHLNATEAERIAGLIPKEQILVKQPEASKLLHLRVDPRSYWLYTNNPQDNHRRREAFARYGFREGLDQLARRNA